jgi:NADPH2:quinone reductase
MTKAIRIHANGGPEVMRFEDVELPAPAAGEARVRQTAIGVNYSDVNVRRGGFYLARPSRFPLILGNEAAGVVEGVGPGVAGIAAGDRVAYAGMRGEFFEETGAYAQARNVPADRLIKLPACISDRQAAAMMVKGFTASLIINRIFRPGGGDAVLIHTAAGGVGMILCQWSKHLGATVIGTVGSPQKAKLRKRMAAITPFSIARSISSPRSRRSLRRASRRCSTASARTPSRPRSIACARSECW